MRNKLIGILICTLMIITMAPSVIGTNLNQKNFEKLNVNSPPETPTIEGPSHGKINVAYNFTFVTTDPDGDDVYYWVDWGDGCPAVEWQGPYPSGQSITMTYTYTAKGIFTVGCQARDIYNATSDWASFSITMPKDQQSYHQGIFHISQIIQNLIQNYLLRK